MLVCRRPDRADLGAEGSTDGGPVASTELIDAPIRVERQFWQGILGSSMPGRVTAVDATSRWESTTTHGRALRTMAVAEEVPSAS